MGGSEGVDKTMACHDCGQVVHISSMPEHAVARCSRCSTKLLSSRKDTTQRTLALAVTSLVLFILANTYPFLAMRIQGFIQETNLITGVLKLYHQGMPVLATLVLLTILVFPLLQILGLIYLYFPMALGILPWKAAIVFRSVNSLKAWGMTEVYMLGILISMIKLAKMATIIPGLASGAFLVLICILTATLSGVNPDDVWKRLPVKEPSSGGTNNLVSAGCHCCSLLCRIPDAPGNYQCPRCGAGLHIRKTNSISRTWALVIAGAILYFPANIYPVTITSALGHEQADTILSGVIYFLFSGSWHIAIVIFVASVVVPLMKLIVLVFLLISVQKKSKWKPEERTRLYQMTEVVGRWSMVDVYVVTILVALVQLGPMAAIIAGPGAVYFAAVVVITMFAAQSFDPRLIWDAMEESDERR